MKIILGVFTKIFILAENYVGGDFWFWNAVNTIFFSVIKLC